MNVKLFLAFLTLIAATVAGCGGGFSAPPLELPAPVVGRITISSPDATGKVTITGSEGAVPANAIVLAINERLETSTALWKVSDFLIPSVYAQALPSVCSESGHVCALAASDGSFILTIEAVIGDSIVIVLIDAEGNEISPRITLIVPATTLAVSDCIGLGRTGILVDLYNLDGDAVTLHEGSDTANNKIGLKGSSLEIPGCFAVDLEVIPSGTDSGAIVTISDQDRLAWIGQWSGSNFLYANTYTFSDVPLALAFIGGSDHVAVAFKTSSRFSVGSLALASGVIDTIVNIPNPPTHVLNDLIAMRSIGPLSDGGYLLALLFAGSGGGNTNYFVHFIETLNFSFATPHGEAINVSSLLGSTMVPADAILAIENATDKTVSLLMSDRGTNTLWNIPLMLPGSRRVNLSMNSPSLTNVISFDINVIGQIIPPTGLLPGRLDAGISRGTSATSPVAYVLVKDGGGAYNLWTVVNFGTAVPLSIPTTVSAAVDPILIAVDSEVESIIIGDAATNDFVLADAYWYDMP